MTEQELRDAVTYIVACMRDIHTTATERGAGIEDAEARAEATTLTDDEQSRWDAGAAEVERLRGLIDRHVEIARLANLPGHISAPEAPNVNTRTSRDAFDLSTLRNAEPADLRARAIIAVESTEHVSDQVRESALATLERADNKRGDLARHIIATGSTEYRQAFARVLAAMSTDVLDGDERKAFTEARELTLGGTAGYATPYVFDPTIIKTGEGSVNPLREISTVRQIVSDKWHGVTSGEVTASYVSEGDEANDDSPTLTDPSIEVHKAHAFVPFSIEAGEDWVGMESDIADLIRDAKDDLEAEKFTVGTGSGQPTGVITAVAAWNSQSSIVDPNTAEAFGVADIYAVEEALPPRHRRNASFLANKAIYNKVRQLDTTGGAALWERLGAATPAQLIGYPAREASDMDGEWEPGTTEAHNYLLLFGDFRKFYIIDRVGLTVELVPHLLGSTRGYPTGKRGFYAYWRNGADVVDGNAFRLLDVPTTT